jgi:hypothetical protein
MPEICHQVSKVGPNFCLGLVFLRSLTPILHADSSPITGRSHCPDFGPDSDVSTLRPGRLSAPGSGASTWQLIALDSGTDAHDSPDCQRPPCAANSLAPPCAAKVRLDGKAHHDRRGGGWGGGGGFARGPDWLAPLIQKLPDRIDSSDSSCGARGVCWCRAATVVAATPVEAAIPRAGLPSPR